MCFHNYTQHNGCGHIGEVHDCPWALCADAEKRLAEYRGTTTLPSPPLSPPTMSFPLQKRRSTTKRFFSFNTPSRHTSSASTSSRRTVSQPPNSLSRASTSSFADSGNGGIADHELEAVKCRGEKIERRTMVSNEMQVCKECKKWIREMRFMIERFDKTGNIRGTKAFEEFLKDR
ncbi:hypothetical protein CC78DRAFT_529698 [Lojkania enalia]|uniref:Uncharacterized protein n=1 Tax=Lojkania enalia TaxID=147567 RepID=A0A9P4KIM3_9PLEO|nr:hypothetical protein CC78DRAFT_529698 [Didymosphaeria enalia]